MSILTAVEAKGWRGRLFLTGVTLALVIGGSTMLYPFLIMISGAMRSQMDSHDMSVVPKFLVDDTELVQKFLETKYNYDPTLMNRYRQTSDYSFRDAWVPEKVNDQVISDFEKFVEEIDMPIHWQALGGAKIEKQVSGLNQRDLVKMLRKRFDDDLNAFNAEIGAPLPSWWQISAPILRWEDPRTVVPESPLWKAYFDLMLESNLAERAFVNLTGLFLDRLVYPEYGSSTVNRFAETHDLEIDSYSEFSLPKRVPSPEQKTLREEWVKFVMENHVNLSFVRSDASDADYQAFLRERFDGDIDGLNHYWESNYEAFSEISLPGDYEWIPEGRRSAYKAFIRSLEPESLRLVGPEFAWRSFLKEQYGDLESAAKAHACEWGAWEDCKLPTAQLEVKHVLDNSGELRRRYAGRNFRIVLRQMFLQGRPFLNTIIYVTLALAFTLTVMPLVAYSLSRFHPPGTWKFIFLFVATMAFPPMVDMIPRFLLIQKLGLLNTFIALVLPLTINGMLIFLLKGFFDSIPQDLYDAAVIDGASEFRIFWQITMAMSKPILAVVALRTFTRAWRTFLYPLIVCPDEKMHVLAVWLQQFQLSAPTTAVFASIIIASIPSLLIFLFAQRTIMRGIAVPSEK